MRFEEKTAHFKEKAAQCLPLFSQAKIIFPIWMNNFLNENFWFNFEMNIELNHFLAGFNVKMNNQNVSATPKSGPGPLPMWVINLVTRMVQTSYVDRGPKIGVLHLYFKKIL